MSALIEFDDVCKYYQMGDTTVKAADHISMQIQKGEFVAIVGQSGSGKSTCMNIIGCLDVPTSGVYRLNGRDVPLMPQLSYDVSFCNRKGTSAEILDRPLCRLHIKATVPRLC